MGRPTELGIAIALTLLAGLVVLLVGSRKIDRDIRHAQKRREERIVGNPRWQIEILDSDEVKKKKSERS